MIRVVSFLVVFIFLFTGCVDDAAENIAEEEDKVLPVHNHAAQNQVITEDALNDSTVVEEDLPAEPCDTDVYAYVSDEPGEPYTNIRNAPGGEVILKLPHESEDDYYILVLDQYVEGWFRIKGTINGETDYEIPQGEEGWIHHSVISADTRNYGSQPISFYEDPNEDADVNGVLDYESGGLIIYEACGDWVRCSHSNYGTGEKLEGWIKTEWLCGNPLTNCC